jgi:3-oxoacyl-[acyl-carrier-protein] synthase-3
MKVNGIYIAGIGTAKPELVDTAEAVAHGWYDSQERDRSRLVSISVAGTTPAPDLAVEAATAALAHYGRPSTEISGLFHTNVHPQGPDGWSAQHYINLKTINQPVTSVEIRNGCVGFFSSMNLATCYLIAAPERTAALLTCADNFGTPAADRWRASKHFVLADGAGALVLSKRRGFARVLAMASMSNPELEIRHRGGDPLFPPSLTVGRSLNFRERIDYCQRKAADGEMPPLEDFAPVLIDAAKQTLAHADTSMDEIAKVVHDGFTWEALHDVFLDPLGVDDELGIWEFTRHHGHAGPVDQIRGLEYVWKSRQVGVGDRVMLVTCAPGMEAACAVLEICEAAPATPDAPANPAA